MFGVENLGERLLSRIELLAINGLFRLTKLEFHLFAFKFNARESSGRGPETTGLEPPPSKANAIKPRFWRACHR